ncbi:hypothetical protein B5807_10434 [Epicoccum nigrum]|jgi:hypothetical protein|uniref:Uncharacterized protein n=1 Tax=Epicoccum nigrum TaxID=105696 RepID=A0A1Y2LMY0_EPING|nr:hypothetical protein B5807_10434 [Epicoccum nigrum]
MGEMVRVVLIEGRSTSHTATGVVGGQRTQSPTAASLLSPLPTVRIQQATISQSQQFTIPPDTMSMSNPTAPTQTHGPVAPTQEQQSLSPVSIAGFALIPVGVFLILVAIFAYFWLRKRRRRGPVLRHIGPPPPPPPPLPPAVPKKDFGSPASSFDSVSGGEKARNLSAMSPSVVHAGWISSQRPQPRRSHDSAVHHNPWRDQIPKVSADITTQRLEVPPRGAVESGADSPIDRTSPFRLKRGDTQKRSSFDLELMSAWPAPPQPAAQPSPLQLSRPGKSYMERRSISDEYFAQENDSGDARVAQQYWEDIRLELSPGPGPTFTSR